MTPKELCSRVRVIPVLVVEELAHAVPMARALAGGGLSVLEVTLRSACAPVSYTHLTLPTINGECRSRWSPSH